MKVRMRWLAGMLASSVLATSAQAAPVLMISIDGLRPGDILEASQRGLQLPLLERLAHEGAYATGVRNALPTVTYPNHSTLVTGVWPARHDIASNTVFDPLRKKRRGLVLVYVRHQGPHAFGTRCMRRGGRSPASAGR